MPGLPGFSDNPFRSRTDMLRAATAIIKPLEQYRSKSKARVKLYPSTAAAFDDVSAQLEGFARPLWAISALFDESTDPTLTSWLKGIEAGVDPQSPEYWGKLGSFDQRMVEMESIAFALLMTPQIILSMSSESKRNLEEWLQQINHHTMPQNNWRWFRVLVNLALTNVLGTDKSQARKFMESDFQVLDQFYIGEGWSSDGVWGEDRKQADYYSGSFAIQFAQLLYIRFADDEERVSRYRQQAMNYASEYWRFFNTDGAAIPFGRSMTYRFACGAFWAAIALAVVYTPAVSLGTAKGLLLRHLRWWSKQQEIFNSDGTMNIGFTYPNMYLSEDYNSRQSVYWCLKCFVVLGLSPHHPFWTIEEEPHPMARRLDELPLPDSVRVFAPAHQILCNSIEHHYLLSAGQMTTKKFKAREAKYGKFAYSSSFGYSVPTGLELHQVAPDSTLAISFDEGESWKVRWQPSEVRIYTLPIETKQGTVGLPAIASTWTPIKKLDLSIRTTLVPLASHYPGWHIRVHQITGLELVKIPWCDSVRLVDSSFAISSWNEQGYHITSASSTEDFTEGYITDTTSVLIKSRSGGSGIVDLTPNIVSKVVDEDGSLFRGRGHLIEADPNTNLIAQRTFIPSIQYTHTAIDERDSESPTDSESTILVTAVFGVSSMNVDNKRISEMWAMKPRVQVDVISTGHISIMVL
ncbi:hypothetical protein KAF25_009569 [Fusarium avenaceum]|uniref:DUF2264 domain protein n=1 Tax=Fusarium avenaceum TaxID=40199 RepID=A0A9P7KXP6_9HYPO|nr:hypothetical protein KAF25_009569 [Fusarium avenaceum]